MLAKLGCLGALALLGLSWCIQGRMVSVTDPGNLAEEAGVSLTRHPRELPVKGPWWVHVGRVKLATAYAMPGTGELRQAPEGRRWLVVPLVIQGEGSRAVPRGLPLGALRLGADLRLQGCGEGWALAWDLMGPILRHGPAAPATPQAQVALTSLDHDLVFDLRAGCKRLTLDLRLGPEGAWQRLHIQKPPHRWFWERPWREEP